jgi:hypothetical protein
MLAPKAPGGVFPKEIPVVSRTQGGPRPTATAAAITAPGFSKARSADGRSAVRLQPGGEGVAIEKDCDARTRLFWGGILF